MAAANLPCVLRSRAERLGIDSEAGDRDDIGEQYSAGARSVLKLDIKLVILRIKFGR